MESQMATMRIDKWLWCVRLFKTRTIASTICESGKILIQNHTVKPSRLIRVGDSISIKKTGLTIVIKVLKLTSNRLNAKLAIEHYVDLTPQDEIDAFKARITRVTIYRDPGTGRPTKRERRALDDYMGDIEI